MKFKDLGASSFSPILATDFQGKVGAIARRMAQHSQLADAEPIPTGSPGLDLATRYGGLPRGQIIQITGTPAAGSEELLLATAAQTQQEGGVVAIVDVARRLSSDRLKGSKLDYKNLILSQPDSVEQALTIADELAGSGAVDLLVLDSLFKKLSAAGAIGGMSADEFLKALQPRLKSLSQTARDSNSCIVIASHGGRGSNAPRIATAARDILISTANTRINLRRIRSGKRNPTSLPRARAEITDAEGHAVGVTDLEIEPDAGLSYIGGLLDIPDLVIRRGSHYHYGTRTLGHGRDEAKRTLQEKPQLVREILKQIETTRKGVVETSIGDEHGGEGALPSGSRPNDSPQAAARFVNTWFEGNEPVLPLEAGKPCMFNLQIGSRRTEDGQAPAQFEEPNWGNKDRLDFLVSLYSQDFEIEDPRLILPNVPRVGESDEVGTMVIPLRSGRAQLRIVISLPRELEVLQQLQVTVDVEATQEAVPKHA